jgi:hypothetical protein
MRCQIFSANKLDFEFLVDKIAFRADGTVESCYGSCIFQVRAGQDFNFDCPTLPLHPPSGSGLSVVSQDGLGEVTYACLALDASLFNDQSLSRETFC